MISFAEKLAFLNAAEQAISNPRALTIFRRIRLYMAEHSMLSKSVKEFQGYCVAVLKSEAAAQREMACRFRCKKTIQVASTIEGSLIAAVQAVDLDLFA